MTFRRFALVALLLSLLAGACSSSGTEPAAPATTDSPPETLPFADPTTSAAGRPGGSLVLGVGPITSLDPATANVNSPTELALLDLLFDGLTASDSTGQAIAALASAWSTTDNLTWTFTLADAQFSNGETISSADVKYSIDRFIAQPDRPAGAPFANVGEIIAGDGEVTIVLTRPASDLPALLAAPAYGIVPQGTKGDFASGPFAISDESDEQITLDSTERFDGTIGGIEIMRYADTDAAFDAYLAGEVDWAEVPSDRHDELTGAVGRSHRTPLDATLYYGLNVAHPDLTDIALRRAIVLAIDNDGIVEELFADTGAVLHGIVPPGVPGASADACGSRCGQSLDGAKGWLTLAAGSALPTIGIDYLIDDRVELDLATAIAEDLEAIGIPTELRPGTLDELSERILNGEHMLFRYGWVGRYGSPENWLGERFTTNGRDNVTSVATSAIDDAIAAAREATTATESQALYANAESAVLDEFAIVPLLALDRVVAVNARVHEYGQRSNGTLDLAKIWLD